MSRFLYASELGNTVRQRGRGVLLTVSVRIASSFGLLKVTFPFSSSTPYRHTGLPNAFFNFVAS